MSTFIEKLQHAWAAHDSLVCVGLDPEIERFPKHIAAEPSPIYQFNKAIIDATHDLVCAYKPQFAHYAAYEAEDQLERTIEYIHRTCPARTGSFSVRRKASTSSSPHRSVSKQAIR